MRISHFALRDVRGINVEATLTPGLSTLVTGAPASGKTTVLSALIAAKENAGAYGLPERADSFRAGPTSSLELSIELDAREQVAAELDVRTAELRWDLSRSAPPSLVGPELARLLRGYDLSPQTWKAEYFPCGRAIGPMRGSPFDASSRLSCDPHKYAFLRTYLEDLVREEAATRLRTLATDGLVVAGTTREPGSRFSYALAHLSPKLRWEGGDRIADRWCVWFARPKGPRVELAHLADSEKMAVLFAATWAALGLERSLVLVDHPEQALHPEQHVAFFRGLEALMSTGQLIATTTSPAILRSAPQASVIVLD